MTHENTLLNAFYFECPFKKYKSTNLGKVIATFSIETGCQRRSLVLCCISHNSNLCAEKTTSILFFASRRNRWLGGLEI